MIGEFWRTRLGNRIDALSILNAGSKTPVSFHAEKIQARTVQKLAAAGHDLRTNHLCHTALDIWRRMLNCLLRFVEMF